MAGDHIASPAGGSTPPPAEGGRDDISPGDAIEFDAFVSYSRVDSDFAGWLVAAARDKHRTFWLDSSDIPPAAEWRDELLQAIRASHAVVFVLSASWLASDECGHELELARNLGKRLVPVRIGDTAYEDVPLELRSLQWIETYRMSPEAVIDAVVSAIDADHERVRAHTRWLVEAARWETAGRDVSLLPRGHELREAESWLAAAGEDPRPVPLQAEYVTSAQRAERKRRRSVLSLVTCAAIIAVLLSGVALWQRHVAIEERNAAESGELALQSGQELTADPEIALILASNAWRRAHTPQAAAALRASVAESRIRGTLSTGPAPVLVAAAQRDGGIVAVGDDHQLSGWFRGARVTSLRLSGQPTGVMSTSSGGDRGILVTTNNVAVAWRAIEGHVSVLSTVPAAARGAISADGTRFVVVMKDGTVRSSTAGTNFATLTDFRRTGHSALSVALSADGATVAIGTDQGTWIDTGHGAQELRRSIPANWVTLSSDGRTVLEQNPLGVGQVQRVQSASVVGEFPYALTASLSPDGSHWAYGTINGQIKLITTVSNKSQQLTSSGTPTSSLLFSDDGELLLSKGPSAQPQLWNVSTGRSLGSLSGGRGAAAMVPSLAPGRRAVVGYTDGTVRTWALPTVPVEVPVGVQAAQGTSLAAGPGAGTVTTMTTAGIPQTWNLATAMQVCTGGGSMVKGYCPLAYAVATEAAVANGLSYAAVAPSPDGHQMAVLGADDSVSLLSTTSEPKELWGIPGIGSTARSPVLAWSADSSRLAYAQADQPLRIVDVTRHRILAEIQSSNRAASYGAVWSDRDLLVQFSDGAVMRYDDRGNEMGRVTKLPDPIGVLAVSPDGVRLALASTTSIVLVDATDGRVLRTMSQQSNVTAVAFSPDGAFLATGEADGTLEVSDVAAGQPIMTIRLDGALMHLVFTGEQSLAMLIDRPDGLNEQPVLTLANCIACQDLNRLASTATSRITLPLTPQQGAEFGLTDAQLNG